MRTPAEIASSFSGRDELDGKSSFFLVGIGGAGMGAIARMLKHRGYRVSGTDSTESPETERLLREGIEVHIGHSGTAIRPDDALILTDAIDLSQSPEVARAQEIGIPIVRRSQALGWILKGHKVIAVTGTHGKTTTTGMVAFGLVEAGLDPLVVAGASLVQLGGPVREGKGEWAVVEACEAYNGFHDIDPTIVVLTNLELDHVDFHLTYANLRASVLRFVDSLPERGSLVYCADDPGAAEIAAMCRADTVAYSSGAGDPEPAQKGAHNALNAAGALAVCSLVGANSAKSAKGILEFQGAERRQQVLFGGAVTVIDDYAHHPTEVRESLKAIRRGFAQNGRLIVVFQPHLYSRTAPLITEFAEALDVADEVVITDIYPAREAPMPGVSSARIAEKVAKPIHYVPSRHLLPIKVAQILRPGDVVVGMGAGTISEFAPALIDEIGDRFDVQGPVQGCSLAKSRRPLRIAVLYGGDSAEREVSIHSGRAIHAALQTLGYDSSLVDMTEVLLKKGHLGAFLGPKRPDLAFLATHGTHAEDGAIQGLLELLHIPYTGSGIQASAIAMDKAMTKAVLSQHGIRVPKGALLTEPEPPIDLQPPLIVKPNAQGSTVGLSFVENRNQLCPALLNAFAYDDSVLVEEWIVGKELSTPVLVDKALPPVEIAPASGKYDFESKYTPGATMEIIPARITRDQHDEAQGIALKAHRALRCAGATRTDMMLRGDDIFVLEVNTLPGMTGTSLLPNSAAAAGIPFDRLCQILVEDALGRHAQKA